MSISAPTDIANCSLWLKATAGITEADATGRVSGWADQSGAGNNFAQAVSARQPHVYRDRHFGSRVCFSPVNTDDHFLTSTLPVDQRAFSLFIVQRSRSVGAPTPWFNNSTGAGPAALIQFNLLNAIYNGGTIRYGTIPANTTLDCVGMVCGSSNLRLYSGPVAEDFAALAVGSTTYASLGRWNADTTTLQGDIYEVIAYSREISESEQADVLEYINLKYGIGTKTAFIEMLGDSITAGADTTNGENVCVAVQRNLHYQGNLSTNTVAMRNRGVSSYTWANIAALGVSGKMPNAENYVWLWAGTNDIAGGATPEQAFASYQGVRASWESAGWIPITIHMIPRSSLAGEATRKAYNSLLASAGGIQISLDSIPQIANLNTSFYGGSLIHPNSAGHELVGHKIAEQLKAELFQVGLPPRQFHIESGASVSIQSVDTLGRRATTS